MKCVCGYERRGWTFIERKKKKTSDYVELDKDMDEFIRIDGSFHVNKDYETRAVSIYACPACGTLKMES